MTNNVDLSTKLEHLQYILGERGSILIRTNNDGNLWFVNCHMYKKFDKDMPRFEINSTDNTISIYRNYVTDLDEAINNCIELVRKYYDDTYVD